jgi:predicted nucleic acid-binding protein
MYLFDTDALSQIVNPNPPEGLILRLADVLPEQQFTSAITVGELTYGAHKSNRRDHFLQQFRNRLWPNIRVVPFDHAAAEMYGRLRAMLEHTGTPLADADLRIASIALTRQMILVTGNLRHFSRVPGLTVEDWLWS